MSSAAVVIGLFKVNRYMNYEMNRYNSKGDHSDLNVFCHTFQCGGDGGVWDTKEKKLLLHLEADFFLLTHCILDTAKR